MDTKKITALLKVIDCGSISKAAEELNYSQSGLMHAINSIEAELNIPVLLRNHHGVMLTKEGEALGPYLHALLEQEILLLAKASEIAKKNTAEKLRIGSYSYLATYWLPKIIKELKRSTPYLNVEILIGASEIPRWLKEDVIDVGLAEERLAENFEWIKLMTDAIFAVVPEISEFSSQSGPISLESLAERQLLLPTNQQHYAICQALLQIKNMKNQKDIIMVTTSSPNALLSMVKHGLGVTFMSKGFMQQCPEGVLFLPTDPPDCRQLGIIAKPYEKRNITTNQFIAYLVQYFSNIAA